MAFDQLKRRELIAFLCAAAAVEPHVTHAQQQPAKLPRIGIIDDAPIWNHFRQALRELKRHEFIYPFKVRRS